MNHNITDEEIASIFSNKDAMILAADNATCDQINCFMARVQSSGKDNGQMNDNDDSKIYYAN